MLLQPTGQVQSHQHMLDATRESNMNVPRTACFCHGAVNLAAAGRGLQVVQGVHDSCAPSTTAPPARGAGRALQRGRATELGEPAVMAGKEAAVGPARLCHLQSLPEAASIAPPACMTPAQRSLARNCLLGAGCALRMPAHALRRAGCTRCLGMHCSQADGPKHLHQQIGPLEGSLTRVVPLPGLGIRVVKHRHLAPQLLHNQ